ncbi:MAG TPA: hypothetical protein VEW91_07525 [bacterium]|nr:hypothetical protein [bacterium]
MASTEARGHATGAPPLHPVLEGWAGELATLNRSLSTIRVYLNDLQQLLEWLGRKDSLTIEAADMRRYAHTMIKAGL